MRFKRHHITRKYKEYHIAPDEVLLDAENRAGFDTSQLEGRLERPITQHTMRLVLGVFALAAVLFLGRLWFLQIAQGETFLEQSENNRLDHTLVFAKRGGIYDRHGRVLATNAFNDDSRQEHPARVYATSTGLAHVLGHISYPKKDSAGFYFQENTEGKEGVEAYYDTLLAGTNGSTIIETDARGQILSQSTFRPPKDGRELHVTIDAQLQEQLYSAMEKLATDVGFVGGASVILDVTSGEVVALVSYPEYDSSIVTEGENTEAIEHFLTDDANYFLNRATAGLYTPGSIIKPFVAVGALDRNVVRPEKTIVSTGELRVPNPFDPDRPTIFKDWKAHGAVDLRDALAVSSNVYFFQIGGGFEDQPGIGISGIEEYARLFGIAAPTGIDLPTEAGGVVPNPEWKERNFTDGLWRVGDTYNTAIGQYGLQVTPLQMARAIGAIANDGTLVEPHLWRDSDSVSPRRVTVDTDALRIVREGMRQAVVEGTAQGLNVSYVDIAAKTGTAELGVTKSDVNSWAIGFFPYERPRYAFATVMERGPATNLVGSIFVMRTLFDWMSIHTPEYFFS